ncbi:alpha/beta hydrolase [Alcaligenaceae bacterium CGII-47]|nr:alpha/beta hydrolase [Alcaligenaceae bacterium CGII-47]
MHRIISLRTLGVIAATLAMFVTLSTLAAQSKNLTITAPDGIDLAVQESGNPDGPAVIFIHGLLGSHLNWDAQSQNVGLQRYRIITYDLRGHGQSSKPMEADAYRDGRKWADDLAAVINSTHARTPVLVGWSLGGTVISNYLAAYGSEHIAGAVYVDGVIELTPDQIVAHPQVYRDMVSQDLRTHLDAERTFLSLCFHTRPDTATFERLIANAAMASWDMQSAIQSMNVAASAGLSKARVPILLIYGAHDALVNTEAAIARAQTLNPQIQNKIYANSGHAPFIEEPDRFNQDLSAFIDISSVQ